MNSIDNRELGYSCDIALQQLMELYASSNEFRRDWSYINTRPELTRYKWKLLKRGRRGESLIVGLIKHRDNYTRLSHEWRHDWKALVKILPDGVRLEVGKIAERWGLRCKLFHKAKT